MTITHPTGPPRVSLEASPGQLSWLTEQVRHWQASGLVDDAQAAAILSGYQATRRLTLARLLLTLGAGFVGVGLIWLVAANLDALSPAGRVVTVAALWLAVLAAGELLASRAVSPAVVGAVRLLAALGFGALVAQTAQALQVPAWESTLIGCWALGALVHAYVVQAVLPLVVGVGAGTVWLVWRVAERSDSVFAALLAVGAVAVLAVALAALHRRWVPAFTVPWREVGALLALGAVFVAAFPMGWDGDLGGGPFLGVVVVLAVLAAGAATLLGSGAGRWEPVGAVGALAAIAALQLWEPRGSSDVVTAGDVLHAGFGVAVYVALAVGVAVLGSLHDSWRLTALATAALVVFTTAQSFSVFARIVDGAWLFLLLGLVFAGTGLLFDRARRRLTSALTSEPTSQPTSEESS